MKKLGFGFLFLAVLGLVCLPSLVCAAPEGGATSAGVWWDGGNRCRGVGVMPSTTVVQISSPAALSGLGIGAWRERVIINFSTTGAMAIYFNPNDFSTFKSSFGVVLSSATSGMGIKVAGDANVFRTYYQGPLFAIWDGNALEPSLAVSSMTGRAGAGGWECYEKK